MAIDVNAFGRADRMPSNDGQLCTHDTPANASSGTSGGAVLPYSHHVSVGSIVERESRVLAHASHADDSHPPRAQNHGAAINRYGNGTTPVSKHLNASPIRQESGTSVRSFERTGVAKFKDVPASMYKTISRKTGCSL